MSDKLAKNVKKLRTASRKTLRQVSADTGIAVSRLSQIEGGAVSPTEREINALARHYGSMWLLREWWVHSETHSTVLYFCERMGMTVPRRHSEIAHQFGMEIRRRALKAMELIRESPDDEAVQQEHYMLAGQELTMASELCLALKMLVCDNKR